MHHLAAFITFARFACDAAPSPSGRATRRSSVGTAEPPYFCYVHLASKPPRKPRALVIDGCVFAAGVEPSADQIVPILRDFTELTQSTRFVPRHQRVWILLPQPLHAGCDAGTSPLAAPRNDHRRPRSKSSGSIWTPPSSDPMASC